MGRKGERKNQIERERNQKSNPYGATVGEKLTTTNGEQQPATAIVDINGSGKKQTRANGCEEQRQRAAVESYRRRRTWCQTRTGRAQVIWGERRFFFF